MGRTTDGLEHDASDPTDRNFDPKQTSTISPPPQGTKFRFFNPGPRPAGWEHNPQNREEFLAAGRKRHEEMGDSYEHLGTIDHPGMHKTPTIDYIMILRGNGEPIRTTLWLRRLESGQSGQRMRVVLQSISYLTTAA